MMLRVNSQRYKKRILRLKEKEETLFNLRLGFAALIFILLFASLLIETLPLSLPTTILGVVIFPVLLYKSQRLRHHREDLEESEKINQRLHDLALGQAPLGNPSLLALLSPQERETATDLDIVGPHSLMSAVDFSFSDQGRQLLLNWLSGNEQSQVVALGRQKKIQNLYSHGGFLKKFFVLGRDQGGLKDLPQLTSLLSQVFLTPKQKKFYFVLLAIFALACVEFALFVLDYKVPVLFRLAFPVLSLISLRSISPAFQRALSISGLMGRLSPLFQHLEKLHIIAEIAPNFKRPQTTLFERKLSFLTVNSHPLVAFLLNIFLPWNWFFTYGLERERLRIVNQMPHALEALYSLQALGGLTFLGLSQNSSFATFNSENRIQVEQLRHPLSSPNSFIPNDFSIGHDFSLAVLTGSNMSGKSTFLRTLGVNYILACAGGPVFATKFECFIGTTRTCLRVSDSLRDGASYFYAEVQRLKSILEAASNPTPLLFLVDEIFKGTNNRERFLGSRDVIRALAKTNSLGLVSTHDLELANLAAETPKIRNFHFSDQIRDSKMHFDYTLREGPCPSTNALRIMKMEGLPVVEA